MLEGMKKSIIIALIIAVIVIGGVITGLVIILTNGNGNAQTITHNPTYQTAIPNGKSITWQRISPPGNDPVYAYADKITGVDVTVSEQPLPSTFQKNTDSKIADLARSYNATDTLNAGNTKLYIGLSAKGPQSVIFTKMNLLILIKSQDKIKDSAWTRYVESLN